MDTKQVNQDERKKAKRSTRTDWLKGLKEGWKNTVTVLEAKLGAKTEAGKKMLEELRRQVGHQLSKLAAVRDKLDEGEKKLLDGMNAAYTKLSEEASAFVKKVDERLAAAVADQADENKDTGTKKSGVAAASDQSLAS